MTEIAAASAAVPKVLRSADDTVPASPAAERWQSVGDTLRWGDAVTPWNGRPELGDSE